MWFEIVGASGDVIQSAIKHLIINISPTCLPIVNKLNNRSSHYIMIVYFLV
jgi:hypothetical protein